MRVIYRYAAVLIAVLCIIVMAASCDSKVVEQSKTVEPSKDMVYRYTLTPVGKENFSSAEFAIWLPGGIETYRGVLYLGPGYESSSIPFMEETRWQELAREHKLVILTSCMFSRDEEGIAGPYWMAEHGSGQALLNALSYFAKESKHPEIENAPLAMWGHSAGGQFGYAFACWKPERVITFVAIKGGYYLAEASEKVLKMPALWFVGEFDEPRRLDAVDKLFQKYMDEEPLWSLGYEQNAGHEIGRADELAIPWLKEMIEARLPKDANASKGPIVLKDIDQSKAWLGDMMDGYTAPASNYERDRKVAIWIPNEKLAKLWRAFRLQEEVMQEEIIPESTL